MLGAKLRILLSAVLFVSLLSASNTTSEVQSNMAQSLCYFKILIVGVLPTIALILFMITPFAIGLGVVILIAAYLLHRKNNPEAKVDFMKFRSLPTGLKIGMAAFAISLLTPMMGVLCIVLAIIAPVLVNLFIAMTTGTTVAPAC